tara:strand:- start:1152 stop:1433 length:282 start_codon:yes stop_codon:yes gene_type:complete
LFKGAYLSDNPEKEIKRIKILLETCCVLDLPVHACEKFGKIAASLIKTGKMVEDADLLIASIVLNKDHILITNNTKHFSRIKNLKLKNWMERV